jgi:hypothetical protein
METFTAKIKLDLTQYKALIEESKNLNMTLEDFLANLIKQYLMDLTLYKKHTQKNFMSIVALGDSGTTDISDNHDKYLGEVISDEHLR